MGKTLTQVILLMILAITTSCCVYRMPTEEDSDVMPRTNNPNVIDQAGPSNFMPVSNY